jgi:hypothetical protein
VTVGRDDLREGARAAVDRALARRRRLAVGLLATGLATIGFASPVAGQVSDEGVTPSTDDATPSTGGTDPYDAGSEPVPSESVSGDGTTEAPAASEEAPTGDDGAFATESVVASGDGEAKPGHGRGEVHAAASGTQSLLDGAGNVWWLNTDMSFSTTSSASGAFSEASMVTQSGVTTSAGGTTTSSLDDAFDGYGAMCLDLGADAGDPGTCTTDDTSIVMYNQLGPLVGAECSGREMVFPVSTDVPEVSMQRRVFVPDAAGANFARWTNTFTNTSGASQAVRVTMFGNLGSDGNTVVTGSSSGDTTAADGDLWVTSFQNYSGSFSSDPRLGHVLGGAGAAVSPSGVTFVDGDDDVAWSYDLTLAAGQTVSIVDYASLDISKAASAVSAAGLSAGTTAHQWDCMTDVERAQIVNYANRAVTNPGTNDPAPAPTGSFSSSASTANEGTTAPVTVVRSGNIDEARTFGLAIAGTATSGADYTAPPLTVAFAAGEATKTISIPVATDAVVDGGETIVLTLTDPNAPTDPLGEAPPPLGNNEEVNVGAAALGVVTVHTVTIVDATVAATTAEPLARTGPADLGGLLQVAGGTLLAGGAAVIAGDLQRRRFRWRHRRTS